MKKICLLLATLITIGMSAQTFNKAYINPTPGYTNIVAVTIGNSKTLYVAGQVGSGDTMEEQFRSSFKRVLEQLEEAGATFANVVKMTLYIVDYKEEYLGIISQARKEVFGTGNMPAITMVGIEALAFDDMKVETEAVAIVDLSSKLLTSSELKEAKVFKNIESTYGAEEEVFILDLSGTPHSAIPNEVFDLPNLQSLNLGNTGIKEISEKIAKLKKLQHLNLGHLESPNHNLTKLPANILKLTNLEVINLNGNPNLGLEEVFSQLSKLPAIKILAIMNNGINDLPQNIGEIKTLEQVWLGRNTGLNISTAIERLNQLSNLQQLGFGGIGMESITFPQGYFKNLHNLWLAGNKLSTLQGVEGLESLRSITLNKNNLKALPKEISRCKNLEALSLNNNNFSNIPADIHKLENLKYLLIRENPISASEINRFKENTPRITVIHQ